MKLEAKLNFLLVIYSLLLMGYLFTFGTYSWQGVLIIILCLLLWLAFHFDIKIFNPLNLNPKYVSYLVLITFIGLSAIFLQPTLREPGILSRPANFLTTLIIMNIAFTFSFFLALFMPFIKNLKSFFYLLIFLSLLLRVLIIAASPNPRIDTYDIVKLGAEGLLMGENPYRKMYIPIYKDEVPNYFTYGPSIVLISLPSVILFKDQRYLFGIAEIATAILIYKLLKSSRLASIQNLAEYISLIYLFNPVSLFIILRAWIDVVLIFILMLMFYISIKLKKENIGLTLLGLAISTKQTMLFLFVFFIKYLLKNYKLLLIPSITALLLVLPFIIASPSDFIGDTVIRFIKYPNRHDSLTINSLFYALTGKDIPNLLFVLIWIFAGFILIKRQGKSIIGSFSSGMIWLFIFYIFNGKQGFVNYYHFISSLLIVYISLIAFYGPQVKKSEII